MRIISERVALQVVTKAFSRGHQVSPPWSATQPASIN